LAHQRPPEWGALAYRATACLIALAVFCPVARLCAEPVAVRRYSVADGLPDNTIRAIHQDARGYIWFGTADGVSRFDGYRFASFGVRDGLPNAFVNAIAEDAAGNVWVATNGGGLARLAAADGGGERPTRAPRPRFVAVRLGDDPAANRVNSMAFDTRGTLWCATDGGIYRAAPGRAGAVRVEAALVWRPTTEPMPVLADSGTRIWFGIDKDVVEIANGAVAVHHADAQPGRGPVRSLSEAPGAHVVWATAEGVYESLSPPGDWPRSARRRVPIDFDAAQAPNTVVVDSAGSIWLGTTSGLVCHRQGLTVTYTTAEGLSHNDISALLLDREGNLWIGTYGGGVSEMSREQVLAFAPVTGVPDQSFHQVLEGQGGRIFATSSRTGLIEVVGGRAVAVPGFSGSRFKWSPYRLAQDASGRWWVGTERGLFTAPPGPRPDAARLERVAGVPPVSVAAIHEGPKGRLWVSLFDGHLFAADLSGTDGSFSEVDRGASWPLDKVATRLLTDRSGTLWLAGQDLLGRAVGGRLEAVPPGEGLPEANARALFEDSRGWLWVGLRFRGASLTKRPGEADLRFVNYSSDSGLSGNAVWCVTEDEAGRVYLGTSNGLDWIDPASGRTRHFSVSGGRVSDCTRARDGGIWVATTAGLVRFDPRPVIASRRPPPVYLTGVRSGADVVGTGSERNEAGNPDIPLAGDSLIFEFVGLSFGGGSALRYRYRLEGADADWSAPTEQRQVHYAHLAPGSYRFVVKAVDPDEGIESLAPATFAFRVPAPWWRRWWFVGAVALAGAAGVNAAYRARASKLVALERVRTRVASDLHDDIGSDLSMIAVVSDMARGRLHDGQPQVAEWLSLIGRTSHALVDSMSDIVWAIDPQRDRLTDLVNRMRRFAEDAVSAGAVLLDFPPPAGDQSASLDPDVRREVYLWFKEAINNAVRHSGCRRVAVAVASDRRTFTLSVSDDGAGFDAGAAREGNGLPSMRRRSDRLGASFALQTEPAAGTVVQITLPIRRGSRRPGRASS